MTNQAMSGAEEKTEKSPDQFSFGTWYGIELAKKDGTEYLMYVPGMAMGHMVLFWSRGHWREKASCLGLKIEPTHWMPLPHPPRSGDREVKPKPTGEE